jgi:imidazolonepropionase-like amidohydrolase
MGEAIRRSTAMGMDGQMLPLGLARNRSPRANIRMVPNDSRSAARTCSRIMSDSPSRNPRFGFGLLCGSLLPLWCAGCVYLTDLPPLAMKDSREAPLVIRGATVFTGDPAQELLHDVDILIRDGTIAKIAQSPVEIRGINEIHAQGNMVIPGLIDLHTHIFSPGSPPWMLSYPNHQLLERNLSAFLYAGVTTIFDMGAPLEEIRDLANRTLHQDRASPRMFYAGRMITRAGGHPAYMIRESVPWPYSWIATRKLVAEVQGVFDIHEVLQDHITHGAALTKVVIDQLPLGIPSLTEELAGEIVKTSRAAGLEVSAHIGSEADMLTALKAGITLFAHAPYRSSLSESTITILKDAQATVVSTLIVQENLADFYQKRLRFSSFDREILDPRILRSYELASSRLSVEDVRVESWIHDLIAYRDIKFENVRRMKAMGVQIIAGSDSPNLANVPGSSLHEELVLLVERCGFTPLEAIAAATYFPGRFIGRLTAREGLGHIREGSPADLLILKGDARRDIRQTRRIEWVILQGRKVSRHLMHPGASTDSPE